MTWLWTLLALLPLFFALCLAVGWFWAASLSHRSAVAYREAAAAYRNDDRAEGDWLRRYADFLGRRGDAVEARLNRIDPFERWQKREASS